MGIAAMHDQVGRIEGGREEPLVTLEFQLGRHHAIGVRQHAVRGHDDVAVDVQCCHGVVACGLRYSEMVCTTLFSGRLLTVGSFMSLMKLSSNSARVFTGALGLMCTTL